MVFAELKGESSGPVDQGRSSSWCTSVETESHACIYALFAERTKRWKVGGGQ